MALNGSIGNAVSDSGVVVGQNLESSQSSVSGAVATDTSGSTITKLTALGQYGTARAVDAAGKIAGWHAVGGVPHAFLWSPGGTAGPSANPCGVRRVKYRDGKRMSNMSPDVVRASRAIGAMFYGMFGGVCVGYSVWRGLENPVPALIVIAAVTLGVLGLAYRRFRENRAALALEPKTPTTERRDRWFHIINAGQWLIILVVGNVLANSGMGAWVIPAAMFVVGLHFIPLAGLFQNKPHYITGGALMLLSAIYPGLLGPTNAVGALCAGLILWVSALWAVRPTPA